MLDNVSAAARTIVLVPLFLMYTMILALFVQIVTTNALCGSRPGRHNS